MSNKVPEFGWEARFWLRGQIGLIGQIDWEGLKKFLEPAMFCHLAVLI